MYGRPAYSTPLGGPEQSRYHGQPSPLAGGYGGGAGNSDSGFTSPMPYNGNGMGAPVSAPIVARYGSGTPLSSVAIAAPLPGANRYVRASTTYGAPPPPLPSAQVIDYNTTGACYIQHI